MTDQPYHHGDLRRAALDATVEAIEQAIEEGGGPASLSLREVARRAGVSHAAFKHHFGAKSGLLAALAAEGYDLLTDAVTPAGGDLVEAGVAYVRFAVAHPAHFEVMFQPGLYDADDPRLLAAQERTFQALALRSRGATEPSEVAAWSMAHGLAGLWLSGALPTGLGDDPGSFARGILRMLSLRC